MATIEKRTDTSYRITVSCGYDKLGKQIRKKKTITLSQDLSEKQKKKELQRQSVLFEKEVENGTYLDGDKITFEEFANKWLSDYAEKELAPKTVERYKTLLVRINQALGNMKLCKIQPLHIINFMNNLAENGIRTDNRYILNDEYVTYFKEHKAEITDINYHTIANILKGHATDRKTADKLADISNIDMSVLFSPFNAKDKLSSQTLLHHYKLLNTILNTAVRWNLLLLNPAERVKAPRVEQKEIKYLNDDEIEKMIELIVTEPLKYQAAVYIAVFGGLRIGEVIALKWADIDFMSGKLSITKAGQYIKGMGSFEKSPKNESSKRELKLPQIALSKLNELRKEQLAERLALGNQWIGNDNLFTQWNGAPIFYSTISQWFKKWITTTGLPQVTFHGLRHSNASMLIAHGTNIATVSKRLGHSRISTTSDIYTHAINKMDEDAANTLDDIFIRKSDISAI